MDGGSGWRRERKGVYSGREGYFDGVRETGSSLMWWEVFWSLVHELWGSGGMGRGGVMVFSERPLHPLEV